MITTESIDKGYDNEGWFGFGYLGERRYALSSEDPECPAKPNAVALADLIAVKEANRKHWTEARFFEWLNSKNGRWFADVMFSGGDLDMAVRYVA